MLTPVWAQDEKPLWEIGLGVSALSFSDYIGSDERSNWLIPVPYVIYRGDFLQVDREAVTGKLFKSDRLQLNVSLSGSLPVDSDDNALREGMNDLDPILEFGPTLEIEVYQDRRQRFYVDLPVRAAIASDFEDIRHVGWLSDPSINYERSFAVADGSLSIDATFGPVFGDRRYHDYFYSVDGEFATPARPAYDADAGYGGVRFALGVSRSHGRWWYGAFLRYINISGAAFEDSPLVERDDSLIGGVAMAWTFARSKQTVKARR